MTPKRRFRAVEKPGRYEFIEGCDDYAYPKAVTIQRTMYLAGHSAASGIGSSICPIRVRLVSR